MELYNLSSLCLLSSFLKFIHVAGMINLLSFQVGFVMVFHYGFNLHLLTLSFHVFQLLPLMKSHLSIFLAWFVLLCSNKSLLNPRIYLLFDSRSFITSSHVQAFDLLGVNFYVWCEVRAQLPFSLQYPIVPGPFDEETILSSLAYLTSVSKSN